MIDRSIVGRAVPGVVVDIERGRLLLFAKAIGETDPVYLDVDAARRAGHPDLPAPPTFLTGLASEGDALMDLLTGAGADLAHGLHGEQDFQYHRMVHAGDRLRFTASIGEVYQKKGGALDFVVTETGVVDLGDGEPVADLRGVLVFRNGGGNGMTAIAGIEIGAVLPELRLPAVTRTTLALFAGGSGDHNPVHVDIDYARSAGLPDVFAHGMLSMAYLGRIVTKWVRQEQIRTLSARFVSVTPVGATPICTGTVTAVESNGSEEILTLALEVRLANGTVTLTGTATVVSETHRPPEVSS